ncbi:Cupredoxin [Irpex rosettiformis]|uniref:Cupredoxin n=1 Tax=Irpex rosettiformis TaxID=378272 RepID=A0ACB8TWJ4_9APHY|nr:Cupredoxin [Irpex rosettiformis]
MRFSTIFAALLVPAAALAANFTVKVGNAGGLTFDPTEVQAQEGDTIQFVFLSKNHTVTQSTFANPCTKSSDTALDSGFQFVAANATTVPQYSFTMTNISSSTPLWFYCRQADHCQKGMVFAVNPTADKTFQAYQAKAMSLGSVNPGNTTTTTTNSSAVVPSGVPVTGSGTASGSGSAASATAAANSAYRVGATSVMMLSSIGLVAGLLL